MRPDTDPQKPDIPTPPAPEKPTEPEIPPIQPGEPEILPPSVPTKPDLPPTPRAGESERANRDDNAYEWQVKESEQRDLVLEGPNTKPSDAKKDDSAEESVESEEG